MLLDIVNAIVLVLILLVILDIMGVMKHDSIAGGLSEFFSKEFAEFIDPSVSFSIDNRVMDPYNTNYPSASFIRHFDRTAS